MNYGARVYSGWLTLGVFAAALSGCTGDGDDDGGDDIATTLTMDGTGDATAGSSGGGESDDPGDSTGGDDGPTPSHAVDIQPIWDEYCVDACHSVGGEWPNNDLSDNAYDRIVSTPATQNSLMNFIEPGEPDNSYLWHKLNGTQVTEGGGAGLNMPKVNVGATEPEVVPQADLDKIEAWILGGAPE